MRPSTTDDLDDLVEGVDNVVGWDYDAAEHVARIFVTEKKPIEDLADDALIESIFDDVDVDTDVVAVGGEFRPEVVDDRFAPAAEPSHAPTSRHRPIPDGVSEINAKSTAATGGYFLAEVVDTNVGKWSGSVSGGDRVRLSNNHVYARSNEADFGETIIQPSPRDGGSLPGDSVGDLVGYVPVEDGVRVDIAARTVTEDDVVDKHDLGDRFGTAIRRDNYADLKGVEVIKTGRTTGVSTGRVLGTSATVEVRYPNGEVKVRDCLLTSGMSRGGDSGSDVFVSATGEYVGALFAGSPATTIVCKAVNVEDDFGVELQARDRPDDAVDEPDTLFDTLIKWLIRAFG